MERADGEDDIRFDATIGDVDHVADAPSAGAEASRIRIQLGGELAGRENSAALAGELEKLAQEFVAEAMSRRKAPPPPDQPDEEPTVSVRGLGLADEDAAALEQRLLAHVRLREREDVAEDEQ